MCGSSVISHEQAHDKLGLVSKSCIRQKVGKELQHHSLFQAPFSLDPLLEPSRYSCAILTDQQYPFLLALKKTGG